MIIYDLECNQGHTFEGWFPSAESFETQKSLGMIPCTVCGSYEVTKRLTPLHIGKNTTILPSHLPELKPQFPKSKLESAETAVNVDPVILLKTVHDFVKKNFKNVGPDFADKAIAMQNGKMEKEPIYGSATPQQQERLESESVDYSLLPKLPETFEN